MDTPIQDIDFSTLPVADRLLLAEALLDSLHDAGVLPIPAEHIEEINRRISAVDSGCSVPMTRKELRAKLPKWYE